MNQLTRQQQILELLSSLPQNHSLSIKEIAKKIYSSESSVRRDILILQKSGLLIYKYGGVTTTNYKNDIMPIALRNDVNSIAKETVAVKASQLITNGDVIFLDASTTAFRILRHLKNKKNLTIITHNYKIFSEHLELNAKLFCVGGRFNPQNANFLGPEAEEYIRNKYADIAFFSSLGLSYKGDISDVSIEETSLRKVMISRAKRQYFLCDSSKIGREYFTTLCNIKQITDVICDNEQLLKNTMDNILHKV